MRAMHPAMVAAMARMVVMSMASVAMGFLPWWVGVPPGRGQKVTGRRRRGYRRGSAATVRPMRGRRCVVNVTGRPGWPHRLFGQLRVGFSVPPGLDWDRPGGTLHPHKGPHQGRVKRTGSGHENARPCM